MQKHTRRANDGPTWQKVAHNIVLVGSAITALLVGFRVIGRYHIDQEKIRVIERNIEALTANVESLSDRIGRAEREFDRGLPQIRTNAKEIDRLRDRGIRQ